MSAQPCMIRSFSATGISPQPSCGGISPKLIIATTLPPSSLA